MEYRNLNVGHLNAVMVGDLTSNPSDPYTTLLARGSTFGRRVQRSLLPQTQASVFDHFDNGVRVDCHSHLHTGLVVPFGS